MTRAAARLRAVRFPLEPGPSLDPFALAGSDGIVFRTESLVRVGLGTALSLTLADGLDDPEALAGVMRDLRSIPVEDHVPGPGAEGLATADGGPAGSGVVAFGSLPFDRSAEAVLLVPAIAPRRIRERAVGVLRPIIYFPALGLGFLFIEIYLIGQASLWLHDRTSGFALVLTGMLVFSGLGSLLADRLYRTPRRATAVATLIVVIWIAAALAFLRPLMLETLSLPWAARAALVLAVAAPVSLALGLMFPLGLGTERRILRRRDTFGQSDRASGRI